jgi:L-lactate dehydrogenase complex protein LldE
VKVHLFIPCLVDQAAPATAFATRELLRKIGCEVIYDRRQTCCGQALFNAGFRIEARTLAERFVGLFREAEVVVAPSGSCVSMVVNHYGELGLFGDVRRDYESLRTRVYELSQFLVDVKKTVDLGAKLKAKVAYHPSCHLTRDLGVTGQPLKLLQAVEGIDLIGSDIPVECCGFGGAFSVKYPKLSQRIADRRAAALEATGAEIICGGDDSCLGHLRQAFRRMGSPVRVLHYSRLLNGLDPE